MDKSFVNFRDQVCLITGAGSETGIGFNTGKILGSLGGRIALIATTDRIHKRADELKAMGIEAKGYIANLMDRDETNAVIKPAKKSQLLFLSRFLLFIASQTGRRRRP